MSGGTNNLATSTNLGLVLNNASEDTLVIDTWIDTNTGTAETSNMQKIDAAYGALNTNKINISSIANNVTETVAGKVLDATQGTALALQISQLADLSTMSFKVIDVDTSTQYAFGLQIKDGKTQLMYEEVV